MFAVNRPTQVRSVSRLASRVSALSLTLHTDDPFLCHVLPDGIVPMLVPMCRGTALRDSRIWEESEVTLW